MNCIERTATLYSSSNDTLYRKDNLILEKRTFMGKSLSFLLSLLELDDVQGNEEVSTSNVLLSPSLDIVDFNTKRRKLFLFQFSEKFCEKMFKACDVEFLEN